MEYLKGLITSSYNKRFNCLINRDKISETDKKYLKVNQVIFFEAGGKDILLDFHEVKAMRVYTYLYTEGSNLNTDNIREFLSGYVDGGASNISKGRLAIVGRTHSFITELNKALTNIGIKNTIVGYKQRNDTVVYGILISQESIKKLDLDLHDSKKREALNNLIAKSRGSYVDVNEEFIHKYFDKIKLICGSSKAYKLKKGVSKRIKEEDYLKII